MEGDKAPPESKIKYSPRIWTIIKYPDTVFCCSLQGQKREAERVTVLSNCRSNSKVIPSIRHPLCNLQSTWGGWEAEEVLRALSLGSWELAKPKAQGNTWWSHLWVLQGRIQGPYCDIYFYININMGFGLNSSGLRQQHKNTHFQDTVKGTWQVVQGDFCSYLLFW